MMEEASSEKGLSTLGRAARFRDGLVVAFLGFHPLRLRNLASLRVGHHLVREGTSFVLKLAAAETKGGQAYEAVITGLLADAIHEYLVHQRPVLLKARGRWHATGGDAFWVSRDGSPCSEKTFANIVAKHVSGADGRPLSPHLFRSCSATSVATKAPCSIDIIPAVLGHSSLKTGERYYNMSRSLEASRAHGAMIEELQRQILHHSQSEEPGKRR
jgi:integrase